MDKGNSRLCAFCTCSVTYKPTRVGSHGILHQFYKEFIVGLGGGLQLKSSDGCAGDDGGAGASGGRALRKCGDKLPENWAVCNDCLPSVQGVLGRKDKVNRAEAQVRKLQVQILRELNGLAREVKLMCEEMRVVEGIMGKGGREGTSTEKASDGGGAGRRSKRKREEEGSEELISSFRDKVETVIRDLESFNRTTSDKLLVTNDDSDNAGASAEGHQRRRGRQRGMENAVLKSADSSRNVKTTVEVNDTEETEVHVNDGHGVNMEMEDSDSHDDSPSPAAASPEDVDEADVSMEDEVAASGDKTIEKRETRQIQKNPSGDPEEESEEDSSSSSEEEDHLSDDDFDPDDDLSGFSKDMRKFLRNKSIVRRNLIIAISQARNTATSKYLPSSPDDPRRNYAIRYDRKEDTFFLEHVEIICLDKDKRLQCSECSATFETKRDRWAEDVAFDHILGHHLNAYVCNTCGKTLRDYTSFQHHKASHEGEYDCDICGRPMSDNLNLQTHKWRHFSEAEKADPANAHMMPRSLKKERAFQCTTCGKAFKFRRNLTKHEDTHKDMEEREKIMCTDCGALVLRDGYKYHWNRCPSNREKGVKCPVCQMLIQNMKLLDKHLKQDHPDSRSYLCPVCGKGFRTKTDMKAHMPVHSEAKNYICRHCGMGFKMSKNLPRHEKSCRERSVREVGEGNYVGVQEDEGEMGALDQSQFVGHFV